MPRKSKYEKDGFTNCNCGECNFNMYMHKVFSMSIDFFCVEDAGFMTGWTLYSSDGHTIKGNTVEDFIECLDDLKKRYNLEVHSDSCRDCILIYIDEPQKILGFFRDYVTTSFSDLSVTLMTHFEFRSYKGWDKKVSAKEAVTFMQNIADKVFIPEKYFYLTPNQRTRKLLKKACFKEKSTIAKEIFPETPSAYSLTREALFGGICYCPVPNVIKEVPMMELDIKSAYIYSLLTKKFPVSRIEDVKPEQYEYYLNNDFESAIGVYKIKYSTSSNIVTCYKYYDENNKPHNLQKGEDIEVLLTLTSTDLEILTSLPRVYITKIECIYLEAYKMDYLPKYVRDRLVIEYIKKSEIDEDTEPELYKVQKVVLNGIYGNMIKKILLDGYAKKAKKAYLAPQWGIWCTSYTKKHLLNLALKVSGWVYSDTDSIYCFYTENNIKLLEDCNCNTVNTVALICDMFDLDFEQLKELGKFELKHRINKFKALCQKEYLYTTIEGTMIVKAAGCNKDEMKVDDSLYNLPKLPVGTKKFGFTQDEDREVIIDGKRYVSKGSYYEVKLNGNAARAAMYAIDQLCEGDDDL